jgi:hypothetical protein
MSHRVVRTAVVVAAGVLQVCGESKHNAAPHPSSEAIVRSTLPSAAGEDETSGKAGVPASGVTTTAAGLNRKIIYSAKVEIVVENFDGVPDQVVAIVKRFDAYVADSNLLGATGASRHGTWKIRVPVGRFEEFVDAAKSLGELNSASTESQDISEEYFDVDSRIRNKTREEERLLALLADYPGKLDDVMAIERALSHVREELERMQGRLRVLTDLTAMTTVQLTIAEIHNYEPPQTPTFVTRVERAWSSSLGGLLATGEETVVAATVVFPWLAVAGLCVVPCYGVARTVRRRRRSSRDRE